MKFPKEESKIISIGEQPKEEEKAVRKLKRTDPKPEPESVFVTTSRVPPILSPVVVAEVKQAVEEPRAIYTKYGGWIFENDKLFIKERDWPMTSQARSGIVPERKIPDYSNPNALLSLSRQIKKNR